MHICLFNHWIEAYFKNCLCKYRYRWRRWHCKYGKYPSSNRRFPSTRYLSRRVCMQTQLLKLKSINSNNNTFKMRISTIVDVSWWRRGPIHQVLAYTVVRRIDKPVWWTRVKAMSYWYKTWAHLGPWSFGLG